MCVIAITQKVTKDHINFATFITSRREAQFIVLVYEENKFLSEVKAMVALSNFLYPQNRYYGEVKPENLVFNANLQQFTQRVGYISALVSNGKMSVEQAFTQIDALWQQVEKSKQQLGVGEDPFSA